MLGARLLLSELGSLDVTWECKGRFISQRRIRLSKGLGPEDYSFTRSQNSGDGSLEKPPSAQPLHLTIRSEMVSQLSNSSYYFKRSVGLPSFFLQRLKNLPTVEEVLGAPDAHLALMALSGT